MGLWVLWADTAAALLISLFLFSLIWLFFTPGQPGQFRSRGGLLILAWAAFWYAAVQAGQVVPGTMTLTAVPWPMIALRWVVAAAAGQALLFPWYIWSPRPDPRPQFSSGLHHLTATLVAFFWPVRLLSTQPGSSLITWFILLAVTILLSSLAGWLVYQPRWQSSISDVQTVWRRARQLLKSVGRNVGVAFQEAAAVLEGEGGLLWLLVLLIIIWIARL